MRNLCATRNARPRSWNYSNARRAHGSRQNPHTGRRFGHPFRTIRRFIHHPTGNASPTLPTRPLVPGRTDNAGGVALCYRSSCPTLARFAPLEASSFTYTSRTTPPPPPPPQRTDFLMASNIKQLHNFYISFRAARTQLAMTNIFAGRSRWGCVKNPNIIDIVCRAYLY